MKTTAQFRKMLETQKLLSLPGVYDGITARLSEQAGFKSVYMTGAGTSASMGYPDFGLLTMTEMVDRAATIARSVKIPLIADADTGYGNELNVTRTVREFERAGAAGIHIEDQISPKRCGHLDGKEIVSREEYFAKIRAAISARSDRDFIIIARTDARSVTGFDEAVLRANEALKCGADVAFLEAAQSLEEVAAVPKLVNGPCLLNIVRGGKTPDVDLNRVEDLGYRIAILPSLLLSAAVDAFEQTLQSLMVTRIPPSSATTLPVHERFRKFGADEWSELRTKFLRPESSPSDVREKAGSIAG
jgi:2-methylisocitrate lyase-like PEP mutase family enzyme